MTARSHSTLRALAIFAATFLLLVVGGLVATRRVAALSRAGQEVPAIERPDPTWFSVYYRGGTQLDHLILWNGFGSSIEHARQADVLFVGNSRMQFALPIHELRAFEKRTGLKAFALGLPFGESYIVPLRIIEKFDLHPKIVVVNTDAFFREFVSAPATAAMTGGRWAALTIVWEERIAERVWPLASELFPSFAAKRARQYLLRSSTHGAWLPVAWPHGHARAAYPAVVVDVQAALPSAQRFRNALARRGTSLVLACVPSWRPDCTPAFTRALAAKLGVPALLPEVDGLLTGDIGHLCPLSGKRFGRSLLRELSALPTVRKISPRTAAGASASGRRSPPGGSGS